MQQLFTIREAAEITGTSKSTQEAPGAPTEAKAPESPGPAARKHPRAGYPCPAATLPFHREKCP